MWREAAEVPDGVLARDEAGRRAEPSATPLWALAAFTLMLVTAFVSAILVASYRHAYFFGDDFIVLATARSRPMLRFLVEPFDEHIVPLHRLIAVLLDAIQPSNFGSTLLILYAFHALGIVYLYKTLLLIESLDHATDPVRADPASGGRILLHSRASWFLFAAYGCHVYLGALYTWWTAGLHRFPYIAFSLMAIYYFLRYRRERSKFLALLCAASSVAALGFFTKAVLIPIYLLALEACLANGAQRRASRQSLRLILLLGLVNVAFLWFWREIQPEHVRTLNTSFGFQLEFLKISWLVLCESTVGIIHANGDERLALSVALWVAALLYTVGRRPSNAFVWGALALLLVLNVLLTSLPKGRTAAYGMTIPLLSFRYYYELLFLVAVFAALAFQRARTAIELPSWLPVLGCIALIALPASSAYFNGTSVIQSTNGAKTRVFVRRVKLESQRIAKSHPGPLHFVNALAPPHVGCTLDVLLAALRIDALPASRGPGVFVVSSSGSFVPAI